MFSSIFKVITKTPKKFWVFSIIAFIAIFFFLNTRSQGPQLEFAEVKKGNIKSTVSTSGTLVGKDTINLKFKGSGKLAFLNVKAGDQVLTGQVIAGLDSQDLSISLKQAENNLRDKQATLDKILDDIHLFQYGQGGFPQVGSGNETQTQRQLRTAAEVARDNAYDTTKQAQLNLQEALITSPISGIVTQTNTTIGQAVAPSDTIAQIIDNSTVYFEAEVDEADINKISLGQPADITLNSHPDQIIQGSIEQILPQTKTTSTSATVVIAKILLDLTKIKFISGLNGQAEIIISEKEGVLSIPREALGPDNTVLVQTPQGLKNAPVILGIESDADIEIKEGLAEGQKVLLNPPLSLSQRQFNSLLRIFRLGGRER